MILLKLLVLEYWIGEPLFNLIYWVIYIAIEKLNNNIFGCYEEHGCINRNRNRNRFSMESESESESESIKIRQKSV